MPLPPEFTRKGHKKRGGRKKGSLNHRTLQKREVLELLAQGGEGLPPREERLKSYLKSKDKSLAFRTDEMLIEHEWGRPKESIEIRDKTGGASAVARVLELLAAVRGRKS